jgi:flagellar biosynthesis/type III secretory pathway M-ring protein FliF/YscJ
VAKDRFKTRHSNPWLGWVAVGVLLILVIGLLATYVLRPGRSPAEDAQTAAAIGNMDEAQGEADARREKKRSATSLLN